MKTRKYVIWSVVSVAALAMSSMADVVSTNYGDFAAASVDFIQVQEHTTNPGDTVPKYGAPIISANSDAMDFNPVGFSAIANDGGSDITDGNLVFEVWSHQDRVIDEIAFSERGYFSLGGSGTDDTYVDVSAFFYVEITEVDGASIGPIGTGVWMDFSPHMDGTHELLTDGAGDGIWSGFASIDLNDILAQNGYDLTARATKVAVDLDNVLRAYTESGTNASISKKDFDIGMTVEIIPEPASVGLLGFTTLGLLYRRRTKGRSILGRTSFLRDPVDQTTVSNTGYVNTIKPLMSSKEQARAQWLNF